MIIYDKNILLMVVLLIAVVQIIWITDSIPSKQKTIVLWVTCHVYMDAAILNHHIWKGSFTSGDYVMKRGSCYTKHILSVVDKLYVMHALDFLMIIKDV